MMISRSGEETSFFRSSTVNDKMAVSRRERRVVFCKEACCGRGAPTVTFRTFSDEELYTNRTSRKS